MLKDFMWKYVRFIAARLLVENIHIYIYISDANKRTGIQGANRGQKRDEVISYKISVSTDHIKETNQKRE